MTTPYTFQDFSHLAAGNGARTKLKHNKTALRILKECREEGRQPTEGERHKLAKYTGNGTIASAIDSEYLELTSAASLETDNAFQTDPEVIKAIWKVLENLGFEHGRILDPSASIGNFTGLQPIAHRSKSEWVLVEINRDAAQIAEYLHTDVIAVYNRGYEQTPLDKNCFDLAVSNVPFSQVRPFCPEYSDLGLNLHNYFFVKSFDRLRNGGLLAFITSTSTLDNPDFCRLIANRGAYLVGAVRLPCNAFKSMNTEVTTDFVVFQKRGDAGLEQRFAGGNRGCGVFNRHEQELQINGYFQQNPDRILGTLKASTLYGDQTSAAVEGDGRSLYDAIVAAFPAEKVYSPLKHARSLSSLLLPAELLGLNPYSFLEREGKIFQYVPGEGLCTVTENVDRIKAGLNLKRTLDALIKAEVNDAEEAELAVQRDRLNSEYDSFVGKFGNLLDPYKGNKRIFSDDSELYSMLYALELEEEIEIEEGISGKSRAELEMLDFDELQDLAISLECPTHEKNKAYGRLRLINLLAPKTRIEYKKADIFSRRITGKLRAIDSKVETVTDALWLTLNQHGEIRLDLIASLMEKTEAECIAELNATEPQVFYCPESKKWVLRSEYLSGDARHKQKLIATIKQADSGFYSQYHLHYNDTELNRRDNEGRYININPYLLPKCEEELRARIASKLKRDHDIDSELSPKKFITAGLGTPWLDPDDIREFTARLIDCYSYQIKVEYAKSIALWAVKPTNSYVKDRACKSEYSTPERSAIELIELALNQQKVQVDIYVRTSEGSEKDREASEKATNAAIAASDRIKERFKQWLWESEERVWKYTLLYNQLFPQPRKRDYSAPWLTLPGSNTEFTLRPHQKAAVNRILQNPSTLLLHEVGVGKSAVIIAASYEAKRLGKCRKPVIVLLKSTVNQIVSSYKTIYPNARLLIADSDDKNKDFVKMQTGDYDCIILTHDQFYSLGVGTQTKLAYIQEQLDLVSEYLEDCNKTDRKLKRELESYRDSLSTEVDRISVMDRLEELADDPEELRAYLTQLAEKEAVSIDDKGRVKYSKRKPKSAKEEKLEDKRRDRLTASVDKALHHYTKNTIKSIQWEKLGCDFIGFDECFPYETPVITDRGVLPIGEIAENRLAVNVLSCNLESNALEWKPVTAWMPKPLNKRMVKVSHEDGDFCCTEDHKIWTVESGYVKAGELNNSLHLLTADHATSRVIAVETEESNISTVYDITVKDNHNFFASGVLVSNCHALKNLKTPSRLYGVSGVQMPDTQRTLNCLLKFRYTADRGGILLGATGTMPTNSVAELYVMQRFFDPAELERTGTKHFDSWVGQFAEASTGLEFTSTGGIKAKTRINRYKNFPQLMDMLRRFTDFATADKVGIKRPNAHKITLTAQPSHEQQEVIEKIAIYMDMWKSGRDKGAKYINKDGKKCEHNPLTLTNMGSQNAIDPRLVEPTASNHFGSKLNLLVHNAWHIRQASEPIKGTQLIFCDTGIPDRKKVGLFTVYNYIRDALIALGEPAESIAFIHDYPDKKRKKLYDDVNSGKIRYLLASTEKGGTGVNVQNLCVALHHVDLSWTPAKQEQRNGRGHRQGNLNPDVFLFYYGTAGRGNSPGFDAYKAKLVSDKSAFVYAIMSDSVEDCIVEDIGDDAAMYLMAAAILSGNGQALEHAKLTDRIRRLEADLETKAGQLSRNRYRLENLPGWIETTEGKIETAKADQATAKAIGDLNGKNFRITLLGRTYTKFSEAQEVINGEALRLKLEQKDNIIFPLGKVGGFHLRLEKRWATVEVVVQGHDVYNCDSIHLAALKSVIDSIAIGGRLDRLQLDLSEYQHDLTTIPQKLESLSEQVSELKEQLKPLWAEERELKAKLQEAVKEEDGEQKKTRVFVSEHELVPAPSPAPYSGVEPECIEFLRTLGEPIAHDAEGTPIRWIDKIKANSEALAAGETAQPIAAMEALVPVPATPEPAIEQAREQLEQIWQQSEPATEEETQTEPVKTTTRKSKPKPESKPRQTKTDRPKREKLGSDRKVVPITEAKRSKPLHPQPVPTVATEQGVGEDKPRTAKEVKAAIRSIARSVHKNFSKLGYGEQAIDRVVDATVDAAKREMGLVFEVDGFRYEDQTLSSKRGKVAAGVAQGCLF